jgi:hypothetical protein
MSITTPFNGTQTGTYVSSVGGNETFSRTITNQNGVRTTDTTFTLPDGDTITRDATLTQTATGWTRTATTTLADGKTATLEETGTKNADGSTTVTGTRKVGNRWAADINGTETSNGSGVQTDLSFSDPWGNTWTRDTQSSVADGVKTSSATGTTYSGASFSYSGALTVLQSQST